MKPVSLVSALKPQRVCIVGSASSKGKVGWWTAQNLLQDSRNGQGFQGEVHIVDRQSIDVSLFKESNTASINMASDEATVVAHTDPTTVPAVDLAVVALPAARCSVAMEQLAAAGTKNFVVVSAGFAEEGTPEGIERQRQLVDLVESFGGSLIGPNCVGMASPTASSLFVRTGNTFQPGPRTVDLVSSSGATGVFLFERASQLGIVFNTFFSVGNAAQIGVEDALACLDDTYDIKAGSAPVKLLYIEGLKHPMRFLKHAKSLAKKGCKLVVIKSGVSDAGARAASSHTSAVATADVDIDALLAAAGAVRCFSREEALYTVGALLHPRVGQNDEEVSPPNLRCASRRPRFVIVTHAGGPGIILTDTLQRGGIDVPSLHAVCDDACVQKLQSKLLPYSSVGNPIDILATGTKEHLDLALSWCREQHGKNIIDGVVVIFGSPGLISVAKPYEVLLRYTNPSPSSTEKSGPLPVFSVLPSVVNAASERIDYMAAGGIGFTDEGVLGSVLGNLYGQPHLDRPKPAQSQSSATPTTSSFMDYNVSQQLVRENTSLLVPQEVRVTCADDIQHHLSENRSITFPLVMKAIGPVHKSDCGGVKLNITNIEEATATFHSMTAGTIPGCDAVTLCQQVRNQLPVELFIGCVKHDGFGTLVSFGRGGTTLEVEKDVGFWLIPQREEGNDHTATFQQQHAHILKALQRLRCWKLLQGFRGAPALDMQRFVDTIYSVGHLVHASHDIVEADINPILMDDAARAGVKEGPSLFAVDSRFKMSLCS